jgi:hypothetical protein
MRQIEDVDLFALRPDPRNPKAHDTYTITESVDRFGYVEPVVIDGRTGFIVSGHGRVKTLTAMFENNEPAPEGVTVNKQGVWLVPVVTGWASTSDTEAAAALIALNRTTEIGGWVDDSLLELLDELGADGGYAGVGFDESDIAVLRAQLSDLPDDIPDVDNGGFERPKPSAECPECGHRFNV